jgi:hypothetical protein
MVTMTEDSPNYGGRVYLQEGEERLQLEEHRLVQLGLLRILRLDAYKPHVIFIEHQIEIHRWGEGERTELQATTAELMERLVRRCLCVLGDVCGIPRMPVRKWGMW